MWSVHFDIASLLNSICTLRAGWPTHSEFLFALLDLHHFLNAHSLVLGQASCVLNPTHKWFDLVGQVDFEHAGSLHLRLLLIWIFEIAQFKSHLYALLEVIQISSEVGPDHRSQYVAHCVVWSPVGWVRARLVVVSQVLPTDLSKGECRVENTIRNFLKRLIQSDRSNSVANRI